MRFLLLLFIIIPLMEIVLLIQIGGEIGALATVVWLVLAFLIGVNLIRLQGITTLMKVRDMLGRGEAPAQALADGLLLAIAGVLLVIPGFASDFIALLLLIPPLRKLLIQRWLRRVKVTSSFSGNVYDASAERPEPIRERIPSGSGRTIEGEYKRED